MSNCKRCLVTGAAGFIGSHLCDRLLALGHRVIGLDNFTTGRMENLQQARSCPEFSLLQKDVADITPEDIRHVDWVFHLAGLADLVPSIQNPDKYYHTNVHGTFKLLEACRQVSIQRFVYTASSTCYGIPDQYPTPEIYPCAPEHPYALTKYLGEQLVMHWAKVYKLPALSLRLFNVYGPRSRTTGAYGAVFGVFLAQKLAGKPFTVVGDGKQTRDFTFIADAVAANLAAGSVDAAVGEIFNIGGGSRVVLMDVLATMEEIVGQPIKRDHKGLAMGDARHTAADVSKARKILEYNPQVSLRDGLAKEWEWVQTLYR
ncbi:NAD-dependent epimerase/dehydratase family protein [bacterium]|nr:NAD-dependent epimerase/dehydratase family protein [bacterium]